MSLGNKATWMMLTGGVDDLDDEEFIRRGFMSIIASPIDSNPLPFVSDASQAVVAALTGNYSHGMGQVPLFGEVYKVYNFVNDLVDGEFVDSLNEAADIGGQMTGIPLDRMLGYANDILIASGIMDED